MDDKRSVNFTVVPEEDANVPRIYANFCSIQHSPFDFTLTFCEMLPLGEREIREAQSTHTVRAPVKARMVIPVQLVPGLIGALQENYKLFQDAYGPPKGTLH
ncbi:MAG TPA: DUF3467 domain-containing protein [Vicinamibacteria bacterium]|nr:DUF3467 domain-containing protein [Vicinamibacteria bacterium]